MHIVDTPKKDVSNFDKKLDKRKLRKSSIKSSSTLFSCLVCAMHNISHCSKKSLMFKSYIPGVNTSILPKKHYKNIFYERIVNELHT